MEDILNEASSVVECSQCPWYRNCVMPMRLQPDEFKRELQKNMPAAEGAESQDQEFYKMLVSAAEASQNMYLEACPVFIQRLKASPRLAEKLRKMMQSWGSED